MEKLYPSSICPGCGGMVENVPPGNGVNVRDFCPRCSKYAPARLSEVNHDDDDVIKSCPVCACKIYCPDCNQKIELEISLVGQPVRCPVCNQKLKAILN